MNSLPILKTRKILIAVILLIIILVVTIVLIFSGRIHLKSNPTTPAQKTKPAQPKLANVLYPVSPDPTGRDIYYTAYGKRGDLKFSGVGVKAESAGSQFKDQNGAALGTTVDASTTAYIVGSFVKWEDIPNSLDKYLILEDKLTFDQNKMSINYPKIRIGFDTQNIDNKTHFATAFGVEDLNSVIPNTPSSVDGVTTYKLGTIGALVSSNVLQLIKPGDAISIVIIPNLPDSRNPKDQTKVSDLIDSQGAKIAGILFIRRFNPQIELKKEIPNSNFEFK